MTHLRKMVELQMKQSAATAVSALHSSRCLCLGSKSSPQFKWPACHAQPLNPIYFTQRARKFKRSHCALNKLFMQPCLLRGGVDTVLDYCGSPRAALRGRAACFYASCARTIRQRSPDGNRNTSIQAPPHPKITHPYCAFDLFYIKKVQFTLLL